MTIMTDYKGAIKLYEKLKELEREKEAFSLEIERLNAKNSVLETENVRLKAKVQQLFSYYMKGKDME